MQFYDDHASDRDKFEIVSICVDHDGEMNSLEDLDRHLKPIVENVWDGRRLPFPVALDNSFRTCESFGINGFSKLLIDPQGRLIQGDENTLAEKLKTVVPTDPK